MENSYTVKVANNKRLRIGDLKDLVSVLSSEKLITEKEKKHIDSKNVKIQAESEIFRLLIEKDLECSFKILETLKGNQPTVRTFSDEKNNKYSMSNNQSDSFKPTDNPLKIATVLHTMFGFLDLPNIKNCRLVCHEWNNLAEPFVWKGSLISLGYPSDNSCFLKSMSYFKYIFNFPRQKIPFTAVRIKKFQENNDVWPVSALEEIFEDWGNCLQEVTIDCIQIQTGNQFKMSNQINLTKLSVHCAAVKVSLGHILHIKYLTLHGCELEISKGCKISPIDIRVQGCKIIFEDPFDLRCANEFIDFKRTKHLILETQVERGQQNITLDFNGNFELDCVQLENVGILNWSKSNWLIKQLIMPCSVLKERSKIQVWEMTATFSLECLSFIPESVRKLTWLIDRFTAPVFLPNLEHLVFHSNTFETLQCFQNCKALTTLDIQSNWMDAYFMYQDPSRYLKTFPIQWISNIKNLSASRTFKTTGKENISLQKLVLYCFPFGYCKRLLSNAKVEQVVIRLTVYDQRNFEGGIFQFLKSSDSIIAIGPFNWENVDFPKCRISRLVDKQAEYYFFENKIGTAIPDKEFCDMTMV